MNNNNNNNRLIYLLISIIAVWLFIVTLNMSNNNHSFPETNVNEYNVSGFSTDFTRVVDDNISSVVTVNADGMISSGFIYRQIDDTVYVVSSYHGIAGANNITVTLASTYSSQCELVGFDPFSDLAVLRFDSPYEIKALKTGDSSLLKQGEFVISIGTPISQDYALSSEMGMISKGVMMIDNSITYNDERYNYYLSVIQLSSNLQNGYSGSPIINMNGELVGMNTMDYDGELNFALTVNELKLVADRLINNEEIVHNSFGVKGVYIRDMENYEKTNLNLDIEIIDGLYVQRIKENSIAYHAGVRSGDVITKINDNVITGLDSYLNALYLKDTDFAFEVIRNGQTMNLVIDND